MRLVDFAGDWTVERSIEDRTTAQPGRFTGLARFTPEESGLIYREEGRLMLGAGPETAATRVYRWRELAGRIDVFFEDGRPFHSFDPSAATQRAEHVCTPDNYHVFYDFTRWPEWSAEWRVTGPRKDYILVSRYRSVNMG